MKTVICFRTDPPAPLTSIAIRFGVPAFVGSFQPRRLVPAPRGKFVLSLICSLESNFPLDACFLPMPVPVKYRTARGFSNSISVMACITHPIPWCPQNRHLESENRISGEASQRGPIPNKSEYQMTKIPNMPREFGNLNFDIVADFEIRGSTSRP